MEKENQAEQERLRNQSELIEEEKQKKEGLQAPSMDEAGTKCVFFRLYIERLLIIFYSKIYQAWGAGRSVVSEKDERDVRFV